MKSTISYQGPEVLRANQLFSAKIIIKTGLKVKKGGHVVAAMRHFSDFGDPQMENPAAENFISLTCSSNNAEFKLNPFGRRHPWNRGIDLELVAGILNPGDKIIINLGDTSQGSPGFRCQSFSEKCSHIRLGIDPEGNEEWETLPPGDCPVFEVIGVEPRNIKPVIPSSAGNLKDVIISLKPEDIYGNISGYDAGEINLLLDDTLPLKKAKINSGINELHKVKRPEDKDYHWITAASDDGRFFARSNPFGPSPVGDYNLYWGEIHSQSNLCDGTNSPEMLYEYAHKAAGLDFASVTSHDFELTPSEWEQIKSATSKFNKTGEFVTFLGYEWSGSSEQGGDNNIYFMGDDGPLIYNGPSPGTPAWDKAADYISRTRNLSEVIKKIKDMKIEAMIVPHCGGRCCNLDYYDSQLMPMLEIYSSHRTFEQIRFEAIRRNLKMGFIGGSDDHRGAIGDSHPAIRDNYFSSHSGLIAVYADNLDRESLWDAFFARRVFATNGCRMILDFRIDDKIMGQELECEVDSEIKLKFYCRLDGMFARAELYKNDSIIKRFYGDESKVADNKIHEFSGSKKTKVEKGQSAYHLKVYQTDGGMGWSSPIWVHGV